MTPQGGHTRDTGPASDRRGSGDGNRTGAPTGESAGAVAGDERPLPPYPAALWPPALHTFRLMRDPLAFGERASRTNDVYRINMIGQGDSYSLAHPEYAKRVLLTERETFRKSGDFGTAFGEGLLTVEGEEWRQQRDALQPLFTRENVRGYTDQMVEQIQRRVARWEDGDRLVLQQAFTDMTLDVLFATILGRELELTGDERLRRAAENLHEWFQMTSYLLPESIPTPARRRFTRAKGRLQDEADRLLAERARDPPGDPGEADDLLGLLVGLREAGTTDTGMLTDERLRDQMVTIIFAGHDTTTTTLSFAAWALANNPEVCERFQAEVDALDGPPTAADVDDLQVTDRLVTETLRLYPPVYALPRISTAEIDVGGYRIPADSRVVIQLRSIQRDPRFFDRPAEFRPERWTEDLRRSLHDFAYAPFGGGPRICIGREFALLEAKLALATIGRQYDFYWLGENAEDGSAPVSPEMTLRMAPDQEFLVAER